MQRCIEGKCRKKAIWQRCTQFAGDHPFCDKHAREQKDFQKEDYQSTFFWKRIENA